MASTLLTHGSLFSGIGGFDLAAEWMGWENIFHCEWNPFGQRVLKYYWPNSISYNDITKTDFTIHRGSIDIISGGFPCQPYSVAGKRKGKDDERHLWPHMLRAIQEIQPRWVVGENVRGLVSWNDGLVFHEVQADLEAEGYEVQPFLLPAASVNAPHRRDRIWFIAYSNNKGRGSGLGQIQKEDGKVSERNNDAESCYSGGGVAADTDNTRFKTFNSQESIIAKKNQSASSCRNGIESIHSRLWWQTFPTVSPICNGDDGLSDRLDSITFPKWRSESIKAGGNAIVPQVALQIFKAIQSYENL